MRKITTMALACLMLLCCLAGCAAEKKTINPDAVLQHLLTDISYDTDLVSTGDMGAVYFSGLPSDASVKLYISSTGYFADEVALITVANEADSDAANAAVETHLQQLYGQFQNYIPEELPKIDAAVTWQSGNHIFLVVASDTDAVNALFSRAHQFTTAAADTVVSATDAPVTQTTATTAPTTAVTTVPTTAIETEPPTTTPPTTEAPTKIPEILSQSGDYSIYRSGVVRVDNAAFEPYGYDAGVAGTYANLVSTVADALSGYANVYCMPIPTAISVTLPDDIQAIYTKYCNQGEQIEDIFGKMSSNVIGINCYENLLQHRDEYLYFRTDYHWNGPAAYYAYETFCSTKGIRPYTMEEREASYFDGFLGALYYNHSGCDPLLGETPDTVVAYHPVSESAFMFYHDANGNRVDYPIIQDVSSWTSDCKYLTYAAADQPYAEFHNPEATSNSVLILVKESYGNVLLSYLVDHYSIIYEIDYRYWEGDIVDFAINVGANDILFANNMTMISAGVLVGMLASIVP